MKRSIGIDIERDKISIVQLCFNRGKFSLEHSCVREIPKSGLSEEKSTAGIKVLINSIITEENFERSAKVTITAPANGIFFHNFRTDLSTKEEVQQLLKFELEDDFPIPFDELVVGICGGRELKGDEREFLIGAVKRSELQNQVQTVNEAGLKCSAVTADVCALYAITSLSHNLIDNIPSLIIHADNTRIILAITEKGKLVCVRHFNHQDLAVSGSSTSENPVPLLTHEIEMTLRAIFGSNTHTQLKIFISANYKLFHDLSQSLQEAFNCVIVALNPFTKIDCSEQQQASTDIIIAAGLALIGTNEIGEVLNFLAVDEFMSEQTAETKRGLFVFALLILAIGVLLIVKLYYELNTLENENQLLKQQIREVFVKNLPEEKKIVNELAQMNEKLEAVRAEYNTFAAGLSDRILPLKLLQDLSEKITPNENVRIYDISIAPKSVRLVGTAASFNSV
ncbi:MAG: pilus assembly protein PilM, partial [bacterium]